MILKEGVKLIIDNTENKVFINTGVALADKKLNIGSIIYDNNAYIPNHNWRLLSRAEKALIIENKKPIDNFKSILIKKLPDDIISLIKRLNLSDCQNYTSVLNAFGNNSKIVEIIQKKINEILYHYSKDNSQLAFHRIVFNPPKMETLTYYLTDKKLNFIGLHIDGSTVFDFSNVENSANRICINITDENRIVYFVNLTLKQMLQMLKNTKTVDMNQITVNNVGTSFFQAFPKYPIIKVVQSPYEYYIMPTDNVLHDGSSLGKTKHDICLVYLGDFNTHPYSANT